MFDGVGGVGGPQGAMPVSKGNDIKEAISIGEDLASFYLEKKYGLANPRDFSVQVKKGPGKTFEISISVYKEKKTQVQIDYKILGKVVDEFLKQERRWMVEINNLKSTSGQAIINLWPPPKPAA